MRTIAEILKSCKHGDILVAGTRKWVVEVGKWEDNLAVAMPANKRTKFELWSSGLESAAYIPGLKKEKKK